MPAADVLLVQLIPSGEVIVRFKDVPPLAIATNILEPVAPPNVTEDHGKSLAEVRLVQVIPSGDVITRLPTPELATATNNSEPG